MKLISRRQVLGGVGAAVAVGTGLMPRRARNTETIKMPTSCHSSGAQPVNTNGPRLCGG